MLRTIAGLAVTISLLGTAALAGEEAKAEEPKVEESKPGIFAGGNWADAQGYADKARLVVVAKVIDAGGAKGKGWNPQNRGNNNIVPIDIQQELVVEVSETICGKADPGRLTVSLRTCNYPLQSLYQMLNKFDGKRWTRRQTIPAGEFALIGNRTYLLFLTDPKPEKDEKGQPPAGAERMVAVHLEDASPVEEPDAQLLASVRGFCRALAAWKDPPKLSPDEDARIKALVADLGADDFDKREAAEAELRKCGAAIKAYLDAAAKDKDAERSFRARGLLNAAEPAAGKTQMPIGGAAADVAKPGTMKERPQEQPEKPGNEAPGPIPEPPAATD